MIDLPRATFRAWVGSMDFSSDFARDGEHHRRPSSDFARPRWLDWDAQTLLRSIWDAKTLCFSMFFVMLTLLVVTSLEVDKTS